MKPLQWEGVSGHMNQRLGLRLLLLGMVFVLAACGESDKSAVPAPGTYNPFEGALVGTDSTLEVVTWNIQEFAKRHEETVDAVVQAVEGMDADIIALQEIKNPTEFVEMRERLKNWDGVRANSAYASVNLAFLYRNDGDIEFETPYEILAGNSDGLPRRPLVLEGSFRGVKFVVINNHFKCCGNGAIDDEYRDPETRRLDGSLLLEEYIRSNYAGQKVIMVGDLNDSLLDVPANNVFQVFFDAPQQYQFVDMDIALGPKSNWSWQGKYSSSHLDHIMITAPLFEVYSRPLTMVQTVPLHTFSTNYPGGYFSLISDHLPVVLKLDIRP